MSLFLLEKCHTHISLSPVKYTINSIKSTRVTVHLHVLPLLLTFAKAEGSTGCSYKPFAAATDLPLLHQGRWLETTSMQPQSIFYPANPSAGCQICFHTAKLLFSLPLNKKTVFIQLLVFFLLYECRHLQQIPL